MRKIVQIINRAILILGVLVALTPCNACQRGTVQKRMDMSCPMSIKAGGMGCCHHGKESSPLCKTMNQSSTQVSSHGLDVVSMPVFTIASSPAATLIALPSPPSVLIDTSPQRAPLSLRI